MNREERAAKWLQASTSKIIEMPDLIVLQEARKRYIEHGPGFTLNNYEVAKLLGIKKNKHGKRRMQRLVDAGVFVTLGHNTIKEWHYDLAT